MRHQSLIPPSPLRGEQTSWTLSEPSAQKTGGSLPRSLFISFHNSERNERFSRQCRSLKYGHQKDPRGVSQFHGSVGRKTLFRPVSAVRSAFPPESGVGLGAMHGLLTTVAHPLTPPSAVQQLARGGNPWCAETGVFSGRSPL